MALTYPVGIGKQLLKGGIALYLSQLFGHKNCRIIGQARSEWLSHSL